MTYARNVAAGDRIIFYPGGERIESFTSPVWMGWLTLAAPGGFSLPEMMNGKDNVYHLPLPIL